MELKSGVGDGVEGKKDMAVSPGSGRDVGAGSGLGIAPNFWPAYNKWVTSQN